MQLLNHILNLKLPVWVLIYCESIQSVLIGPVYLFGWFLGAWLPDLNLLGTKSLFTRLNVSGWSYFRGINSQAMHIKLHPLHSGNVLTFMISAACVYDLTPPPKKKKITAAIKRYVHISSLHLWWQSCFSETLLTFAGWISIIANENVSWKDILFCPVTCESYSMGDIHAQMGGRYLHHICTCAVFTGLWDSVRGGEVTKHERRGREENLKEGGEKQNIECCIIYLLQM